MNLRIIAVLLLVFPSAVAFGQAIGHSGGDQPLNLSLPREVFAAGVSPVAGDVVDRQSLPELGGRAMPAGRMPYGSGYEARQRAAGNGGAVWSAEQGGGRGARGMGRHR